MSIIINGSTILNSGYTYINSNLVLSLPISQVQQKGYASSTIPSTHSVVFDASPIQGNLLILSIHSDWYITTPSGWTKLQGGSNFHVSGLYYKVAGVSESSTVSVNFVSTDGGSTPQATSAVMQVMEYSGMAVSPADQTAINNTSDPSPLASGTITTTQADELVVAVACWTNDTDTSTSSWSNSFIEQYSGLATVSGALIRLSVATKVLSATATVSTDCTAVNSTNTGNIGMIGSFKKA